MSVYFLWVASVGALILYFLQKTRGRVVISFLPQINPNWNTPSFMILEVIIFSGIGGYIGMLISEPCNAQQALMAGFGWTAIMSLIPSR